MDKQIDYKRMANTCKLYHSCALCPYNPEDISRFGIKWVGGCPNYDRKIVYALGEGYRKIPDGAVVLTMEQMCEIVSNHNEINRQARRETAQKFADKFLHRLNEEVLDYRNDEFSEIRKLVYEIVKELTGEEQ